MLNQTELISVLMPVYNVEQYIASAIVSMLNQTYNNFELIIVDDASTDSTNRIAICFANNDKRIKLFRNKINLKISKTLNIALSHAKGKYIARMDGDDLSDIFRLEKYYLYLNNNKDIHLVGCNLISIDEKGTVIGKTKFLTDQFLICKTMKYRSPVSHFWMTYKFVYDELHGYRDISGVEDYDFLLRMTSYGYKYTNINEYLYSIRLRKSQNTIFTFGPAQLRLHAYAYKLFKERIKSGIDSFNKNDYNKILIIPQILMKLHNKSSLCLLKAISLRSDKKYISMLLYIIFSLISPFQISYLFSRLKYRAIVKKYYFFKKWNKQ